MACGCTKSKGSSASVRQVTKRPSAPIRSAQRTASASTTRRKLVKRPFRNKKKRNSKRVPFLFRVVLRLTQFVDIPSLKTVSHNSTIVAVVNHLLGITCDDALNRCEVCTVVDGWSQLHWYIRSIDVTCV